MARDGEAASSGGKFGFRRSQSLGFGVGAELVRQLAHTEFPVAVFDDDRRFVDCNEALLRAHGRSRDELIGKRFDSFLPKERAAAAIGDFEAMLTEGRTLSRITITRPDGTSAEHSRLGIANVEQGLHMAVAFGPIAAEPTPRPSPADGELVSVLTYSTDGTANQFIAAAVSSFGGYELVAEAHREEDMPGLISEMRPDVVVVASSPFGDHGAGLVAENLARATSLAASCGGEDATPVPILVVSHLGDIRVSGAVLRAGALGFVSAEEGFDGLCAALASVAAGTPYLDPRAAFDMVARGSLTGPSLTERESAVLLLIARGSTSAECAQDLMVSLRTVESLRASINQKLGFKTRRDLVEYALARNILN